MATKIAWEPGRTGATHNATYEGKRLQIRQSNTGNGFTAAVDGRQVKSRGDNTVFATLAAAKRVIIAALGLRQQAARRPATTAS